MTDLDHIQLLPRYESGLNMTSLNQTKLSGLNTAAWSTYNLYGPHTTIEDLTQQTWSPWYLSGSLSAIVK